MKPMETSTTILIAVIMTIFFGYIIFYKPLNDKYKIAKRNADYCDTTYLRKSGYTILVPNVGNYELQSFDGGKNWYAINHEKWFKNDEVVILGLADSVYPNLMKFEEGLDKLTKYVEKNGAIGSHPINDDDIKALSGAGFTVNKK